MLVRYGDMAVGTHLHYVVSDNGQPVLKFTQRDWSGSIFVLSIIIPQMSNLSMQCVACNVEACLHYHKPLLF